MKDHGDLGAADLIELGRSQSQDLLALEADRSGRLAIGRQQSHGRHEGLALARAALTDHAQTFALRYGEANPLHGLDLAVKGLEADLEIINREDGLFGGGRRRGGQSRNP